MERQLKATTDKVTIINGGNWSKITAIDLGGADVEFKDAQLGKFAMNYNIKSITNGKILNDNLAGSLSNSDYLATFNCDTPNMVSGNSMFSSCRKLTTFSSSTKSLENGYSMFKSCEILTSCTVDLSHLKDGREMFYADEQLVELQITSLDALENGNDMFWYCHKVSGVPMNYPNLVSGNKMFSYCKGIGVNLDFNLPKLESGVRMFEQLNDYSHRCNINIHAPHLVDATNMFDYAYISTLSADFRSLSTITNMLSGVYDLEKANMIVDATHSGWTQSDFNLPSYATCNRYRYVDDLGDGTVRLVFTNQAR